MDARATDTGAIQSLLGGEVLENVLRRTGSTGGNFDDEAIEVMLEGVFLILLGAVVLLILVEFYGGEGSFVRGGFGLKVFFHGRWKI